MPSLALMESHTLESSVVHAINMGHNDSKCPDKKPINTEKELSGSDRCMIFFTEHQHITYHATCHLGNWSTQMDSA